MRLPIVKTKLKFYWKKKSVRALAVLLVLSATLLIQYRLANTPEPVQIDMQGNKFAIPDVLPGQQLVLEGLAIAPSSLLLLSHVGNLQEEVDVHFSNARLSANTLKEHAEQHPPTTPGEIDLSPLHWKRQLPAADQPETVNQPLPAPTTTDKSHAVRKACSTSINIRVAVYKDNLAALSFSQTDTTGGERYRHLVMDVRGGEATVKLKMVPPISQPQDVEEKAREEQNTDDPFTDCGKHLRVSDWQHQLGGAYEVEAIMTSGSTLRLRFTPIADGTLWSGGEVGFFEPFKFETSAQPLNNVNTAIQCRSVRITSMTDAKAVFRADSAGGKALVSLNTLKVGSDRLRVVMGGRAYVTVNDDPVTIDLFELVGKYWLIAGLLTMANAAILTWIVKIVRGLFSE
jgi:hypothetical protein